MTLIEILVYVALLGMIAVFVSNALIQLSNAYQQARAEREVVSNARLILETVTRTVAQATSIYSPTSRFNQDAGELSLITAIGADANHTTAYVDYYIDNGRLYQRPEGQSETPISAASVKVNKFYLERILQGLGREAVKITLQVSYARAHASSTITLNSTEALRGNY